jgi:hypothetical protein
MLCQTLSKTVFLITVLTYIFRSHLAQNFWLVYYFVLKMAQVFNWNRPGYEPVTFKWEWNVQVLFLKSTDGNGEILVSPLVSPQETPNSNWELDWRNQTAGIEIGAYTKIPSQFDRPRET